MLMANLMMQMARFCSSLVHGDTRPPFAPITQVTGPFTILESANGGLPMLDVILCFDFSSSMDDFTKVSVVNRFKGDNDKATYIAAQSDRFLPLIAVKSICTMPSAAVLRAGTAVNGYYPQCLDAAIGYGGFKRSTRDDAGMPPSASLVPVSTDLVVNPDAAAATVATSTAQTFRGKTFPAGLNGILVAVEASRGNLETQALAEAAGVRFPLPSVSVATQRMAAG